MSREVPMKEEKGFTLPELLAALVILAILLGLTIPAIGSYMKHGTKAYYRGLETDILAAGRDYLLDYKSLYPREVGNSAVITLEELVDNKYVDPPKDEKGNECEGKITVVKKGRNKYDYHTCLVCGNYYQSAAKNCEYTGTNNVSKNYTINLNGELPARVNQGSTITVPTATVTELQGSETKVIDNQLSGRPKTIDTTVLGTTSVTWTYRTKKISRNVTIIDSVSPVIEGLQLRYSSGNSYSGAITNRDMTLYVDAMDYACVLGSECRNRYPNLEGSGIKSVQYKEKNDADWTVYNTKKKNPTVVIQKTVWGELQVRVVDESGNSSAIQTIQVQMDRDIPTKTAVSYISGSSSNQWQNRIQLKLTATDNVAIRYYEIYKDGAYYATTGDTWTPPNNFSSNNVTFRAVDVAGNKGPFSDSQRIHMDIEPPTKPTINLNGYASGAWTNKDVRQTFSARDNVAVHSYEFAYDSPGTSGTVVSNPWIITTDGQWTIYIRAVDSAGNKGPWSDPYVVRRDTVKPTCSLAVVNVPSTVNGYFTSPVDIGFAEAKDNASGVRGTTIDRPFLDTTTSITGEIVTGSVTDNAGNSNLCKLSVKTDMVTPNLNAKVNPLLLKTEDYTFSNNINATFGPTGGQVTCNPLSSRRQGVYTVTCTALGNNGRMKTTDFLVRHSYDAVGNPCHKEVTFTCSNPRNCHQPSSESWREGTVCTYTCTDGKEREEVSRYKCDVSSSCPTGWGGVGNEWSDTEMQETTCYSCPSGGTLNDKVCTY